MFQLEGDEGYVSDHVEHCYECGVCILDLDHHCVYFDGCIGKANMWLFMTVLGGFFVCLIFCITTAAMGV